MTFPYDAATIAAIARLNSYYNGNNYNPSTNPGGMGLGGHRVNFTPSLADEALVAAATADAANAASASAANAAASETNAGLSAAKLIGSSATSIAIGTGTKSFTTQANKFFSVGTFVTVYSAANPTVNYMAGQVTAYSGTALSINSTVVLGSGTFTDWVIVVAGSPGVKGDKGDTGSIGPSPAVQFIFSNGITDSDPGNGLLKLNNAAPGSVTYLYFDNLDVNGAAATAWLDSFDDSTNTALRGTISLVQVSDPSKMALFNATGAVVDGTGYRKVPVAPVYSNGTFTNAATIAVGFYRTGNKGADGLGAGDVIGPAGVTDNHVAVFDGTTGKLIKSGGALAAVATSGTAANVANTPSGGIAATNVQAAINELDTEKANLASPTFTGTPAAPTATSGTNTTQIATTAFVKTAVDNLVASSPAALDTLNELAAALGNDANFAATTATALGKRVRVDAAQSFTGAEKSQGASNLGVDFFNRPRNRIINPSMRQSQERGTTLVDCTTGITVAIDQVRAVLSTTPGGTLRAQQVIGTTPNGAGTYLRLTAQATDVSLAAGDYYGVDFPIEGAELTDQLPGTAGAKPTIKSFYFRSSLAGTFGLSYQNGGAGRSYISTFAIAGGEVNTWVRRDFVIPGCTDGTWPSDTSLGARVIITLASGTTFQGTAGAWQSSDVRTTSGQTNFMGTGSATFDIAEAGLYVDHAGNGIVPPWQLPAVDVELFACQRFWRFAPFHIRGYASGAGQVISCTGFLNPEMRAIPTIGTPVTDPDSSGAAVSAGVSGSVANASRKGYCPSIVAGGSGDTYVVAHRVSVNARF